VLELGSATARARAGVAEEGGWSGVCGEEGVRGGGKRERREKALASPAVGNRPTNANAAALPSASAFQSLSLALSPGRMSNARTCARTHKLTTGSSAGSLCCSGCSHSDPSLQGLARKVGLRLRDGAMGWCINTAGAPWLASSVL